MQGLSVLASGVRRRSRSAQRLHRNALLEKLNSRQDDAVASVKSGKDGIDIADRFAQRHRDLMGRVSGPLWRCNVDEALAADAGDSEDGNRRRLGCAPGNTGVDDLAVAQTLSGLGNGGLGEDSLQAVVNLRKIGRAHV